jgi:hypothetical protein
VASQADDNRIAEDEVERGGERGRAPTVGGGREGATHDIFNEVKSSLVPRQAERKADAGLSKQFRSPVIASPKKRRQRGCSQLPPRHWQTNRKRNNWLRTVSERLLQRGTKQLGMSAHRIIAVGLLTQYDLDRLGSQFTRLWPVNETTLL